MTDEIQAAISLITGEQFDYDSGDVTINLKRKDGESVSLKRKFLKRKVQGGTPSLPPTPGLGWNYPRVGTIYSKTGMNDAPMKQQIGRHPMYVTDMTWGPETNSNFPSGAPSGLSVSEYINSIQPSPAYMQMYWHSCIYEVDQAEPGSNFWKQLATGFHVGGVRYRHCLEWIVCHAGTTLSGALNSSATTITVADTSKFDLVSSYGFQYAVIGGISGQPIELVKVTSRSTSSGSGDLTIERGQQRQNQSYINGVLTTVGGGYPAVSHSSGHAIRPVAEVFGYPGTWLVDVTATCPLADGGFGATTYNDWFSRFFKIKLAEPHWTYLDGIFDDNFLPALAQIASQIGKIDGARNNTVSPYSEAVWKAGMQDHAAKVRAQMPTIQYTGNTGGTGADFGDWMNGGMIEGVDCANSSALGVGFGANTLIGGTWVDVKNYYLGWDPTQGGKAFNDTPLFFFNASDSSQTTLAGIQTAYRAVRFGLCFCLLGPGIFTWDEFLKNNGGAGLNDGGHQTAYWYDEFDNAGVGVGYLGQPTGPATQIQTGVWKRDFDHGRSLVNFTGSSVSVALGAAFNRINGSQAPSVNNGATGITNQVVPAYDGIILLKP